MALKEFLSLLTTKMCFCLVKRVLPSCISTNTWVLMLKRELRPYLCISAELLSVCSADVREPLHSAVRSLMTSWGRAGMVSLSLFLSLCLCLFLSLLWGALVLQTVFFPCHYGIPGWQPLCSQQVGCLAGAFGKYQSNHIILIIIYGGSHPPRNFATLNEIRYFNVVLTCPIKSQITLSPFSTCTFHWLLVRSTIATSVISMKLTVRYIVH